MNTFSPSVKYQDDSDYSRSCNYSPGQSTRQSHSKTCNNKLTNTPIEFMLCTKCKEKISKRNPQFLSCAVGDCEQSISEYTKALNYINSCHTIINEMMMKGMREGVNFKMPDLPNFMEIFNSLANSQNTGGDSPKIHKRSHESRLNNLLEDRSRNSSNENRSISPKIPFKQACDEQIRQTTKGKFIELLPDVDRGRKSKSPGSLSPGTTESEESDLEMNILQKTGRMMMAKKFKSNIKTMHEKVIYEEDNHEDDSTTKTTAEEHSQKNKNENVTRKSSPTVRSQNSPAPQRKTSHNSSSPASVASNSENSAKKSKPRSSSTIAPREKAKTVGSNKSISHDVVGNFSDTAIAAASGVGQSKKLGQKSGYSPGDFRNNKELSQQDLDKYAKELLGSEAVTPHSSRSKSPSPNSASCSAVNSKSKSEMEKRKCSKSPIPPVKLRASDLKKKLNQEKQASGMNLNSTPSKLSTNVNSNNTQQNQDQQQKKPKKTYSTPAPLEQTQTKKPNSYKKPSPKSGYAFGVASSSCDASYVKSRHETPPTPQNQPEDDKSRNANDDDEEEEDEVCSSPEQINLLCDNTETLNMNCRTYKQSNSKSGATPKAQYAVTKKPHDFFTTNRKGSGGGGNSSRMALYKQELEEYDEMNEDSDDIKTDSDIDDGHFDKVEKDDEVSLSRKSSKTSRCSLSHVLNHLNILSNSNVPLVTEEMLSEAKSIRANDERNRPFREPRKSIGDDCDEQIVKIEEKRRRERETREAYETDSVTHLHRTISEESSDIKSDDELYNNVNGGHSKTVPFNYCLGNGRYKS